MSGEIPEDLRRFVLASVPSVPFVEALLLLREAQGAPMPIETLARRLYVREPVAESLVGELVQAGIATRDGDVRYAPVTSELAAMLDRLALHYRANLLGVTNLIHSTTARRAKQFADAFRFRGES